MKILHVYKDFCPPVYGGMERHMALSCRYQRQWSEVEALTCSRDRRTRTVEREGVRVTEVGEWGRFQSAPVSPRFPGHIRRSGADIMVVHVPNPTAELSVLLARPRCGVVVRYQSDIVRQAAAMRVYRPFQMQFLRRADRILVHSQQYLESSSVLQHVRAKCQVIPLGIEPEAFDHPNPAAVRALHERYGEAFVLFCGRHRYYKGLRYLVEAAPAIQARVVIAGDGPAHAACEAFARSTNADVVFPGHLSHEELVAHLHACSIFAFPAAARSEAYGLSMLEAHACGTPVVSTRLGTGVEFVNLDGQTGVNVLPCDAQALAEAVNALLHDADRRKAMGAFARERVRREFRAEDIARQEFEVYQDVAARRGAG